MNCQDLKLGIGVEVNHNPNDFACCHVRPSGFAVVTVFQRLMAVHERLCNPPPPPRMIAAILPPPASWVGTTAFAAPCWSHRSALGRTALSLQGTRNRALGMHLLPSDLAGPGWSAPGTKSKSGASPFRALARKSKHAVRAGRQGSGRAGRQGSGRAGEDAAGDQERSESLILLVLTPAVQRAAGHHPRRSRVHAAHHTRHSQVCKP